MRKYVSILLLFFAISICAQDKKESTSTFLNKTEFKISYSGNFVWNNGLNFGAEYLWKEIIKTKNPKRGKRTNIHQFLINGNLGFTTNFTTKTDTGVYTYYGLIWRRTNKKKKQFSIELNPLGYYRSFLPETYKVKGNDVKKSFLPSRGYYAPSLSVGIGKQRNSKKLTAWYLNMNLMLRTPFNSGTLPSLSFQYGYRFNFKIKNNAK
ncbi:hypothetical protein ABW636_16490 [Aquimarina sp. 2201CG1-2-11]|uniref:hypothetical protein n=1 Tax=Aquimarina discodermiae TaxID=3231043 RepID=UPI0034634E06